VVAGGEWTTVSGVSAPNFARFAPLAAPRPEPVEQSFLNATTRYSYWEQNSRPTNWQATLFDDSAWPTGLAQLGYGDGDEATLISKGTSATSVNTTAYFRAHFTVDTIPDVVRLELLADDGAVVYINGQEVVRDNMPEAPTTITHDTKALTNRTGGPENALRPFSINPAKLRVGNNVIAVEVHQYSNTSDDLSFDAELTGVYNN
jgi:hypothetical protein